MFSCRTCKKDDFSAEQMKKEKFLFANKRGVCKLCYSEYSKMSMRLKKAKNNPNESLSCDDCDGIFSIYNRGPTQKNGNKKLRIECAYCQSENISRY